MDWSCNIWTESETLQRRNFSHKAEENFPNSFDLFFKSVGAVRVPERRTSQERSAKNHEQTRLSQHPRPGGRHGKPAGRSSGRPPVSRSSPRTPPFCQLQRAANTTTQKQGHVRGLPEYRIDGTYFQSHQITPAAKVLRVLQICMNTHPHSRFPSSSQLLFSPQTWKKKKNIE